MTGEMIAAFARHAITLVGGYFVAKGLLPDGTMVETIGGAVSALVSVAWAIWNKATPAIK